MAPKQPKTPATNAGKDVIDDGPADRRTFHAGEALPAITKFAGGENEIGPMADVFAASGYWPDLTPAQIAVHIMAGRSLGLDDAQSVFDLTITPGEGGPAIAYRTRQTYQETGDAIGSAAAKLKKAIDDGKTISGDRSGIYADGEKITDDARGTPKPALPADPASNVVQMPGSADLANKGPLPEPAAELSPTPAPPAETTSTAQLPASAAANSEDPSTDPEPGPADLPDPGLSAGATGDDTAAVALSWRTRIAAICDELGIKDKAARIKEFDGRSLADKRKQFEAAELYISNQTAIKKKNVLLALADDGKKTPDEQRGFFMYAEVPADPETWAYADALKAETALAAFTSRGSAA